MKTKIIKISICIASFMFLLMNCPSTVLAEEPVMQEKAVEPEEQTAEEILDSLKGVDEAADAEEFLNGLGEAADSILNSEPGKTAVESSILQSFLDWLTGLVEQVFGFVMDFFEETL